MARTAERQRQMPDMWPGFVDALAALLVVIIFLVMIFTVAQFFLSELLLGRDRALDNLNRQVAALSEQLTLERERAVRLREDLEGRIAGLGQELLDRDDIITRLLASSRELETLLAAEKARLGAAERDIAEKTRAIETARAELSEERAAGAASRQRIEALALQMARLREDIAKYEETVSRMNARSRELADSLSAERERSGRAEREAAEQTRLLVETRGELSEERRAGEAAQDRIRAVTRELAELRREFARLNAALEASETTRKEQRIQLADLGKRLREALVSKVTELARYRSEFFGKLRELLGSEESIRIVGDRFVFQSEILFASGAADFNPAARRRVDGLAATLKEVTSRIPANIDWVLRVDGHTDRVPIATPRFPSNWELSTARAISVVQALIERGIPANRLVAAGFGENYPLDAEDTVEAYRRNRRIELKLTQR